MLATIVDTKALLDAVLGALATGIGVALIFSIAVFGTVRSADLGREGRTGSAVALATMAVVALAAVGAIVTLGIVVMTNK